MNSPAFEDQQRQNTKPDIPLSLLLLDSTFPSVCIETWLNSPSHTRVVRDNDEKPLSGIGYFFFTFPGATPLVFPNLPAAAPCRGEK